MSQVGGPNVELIIAILRELLEREEVARAVITEYLNRDSGLGCQEYVWTIACTF